jgi:hypothetical protein
MLFYFEKPFPITYVRYASLPFVCFVRFSPYTGQISWCGGVSDTAVYHAGHTSCAYLTILLVLICPLIPNISRHILSPLTMSPLMPLTPLSNQLLSDIFAN